MSRTDETRAALLDEPEEPLPSPQTPPVSPPQTPPDREALSSPPKGVREGGPPGSPDPHGQETEEPEASTLAAKPRAMGRTDETRAALLDEPEEPLPPPQTPPDREALSSPPKGVREGGPPGSPDPHGQETEEPEASTLAAKPRAMGRRSPEERRARAEAANAQVRAAIADVADYVATDDWSFEPEPRDWLIEGLLPMSQLTLFTSHGGVGKSRLALQLANAIAGRGEFLRSSGGRSVTIYGDANSVKTVPPIVARKAGSVLYCGWEDGRDEVRRRLSWLGADPRALGRRFRYLAAQSPVWGNEGHLTEFGGMLEEEIESLKPKLVVIDPSVAAFSGNENNRAEVRPFMAWLNRLAVESGAAILLVAHAPKHHVGGDHSSAWSGSTDFRNAARGMLVLGTMPSKKWRTFQLSPQGVGSKRGAPGLALVLGKANYAREGRVAWLRTVEEHGEGGLRTLRFECCTEGESIRAWHELQGGDNEPPEPWDKA